MNPKTIQERMRALRHQEAREWRKAHRILERLQREWNSCGIKLTYSMEAMEPVRRKRGFDLIYEHIGGVVWCPKCKNTRRIYYHYEAPEPWRKITDYQCGWCGHQWRSVDNTYD